MAALLLLVGCRTAEELITEPQTKDMRFGVFVQKEDNKPINYADGFAWLMKRYDSIHQTNFTGQFEGTSSKTYIEMVFGEEPAVLTNVHSKVFTAVDGSKWVIYPNVRQQKVFAFTISMVNDERTNVSSFVISVGNPLFDQNMALFQKAVDGQVQSFVTRIHAFKSSSTPIIADNLFKADGSLNLNALMATAPSDWYPDEIEIPGVIIPGMSSSGGQPIQPYFPRPDTGMPVTGGGCGSYNGCGSPHGGGGIESELETIKPTQNFNKNPKLKCVYDKASKAANFDQYLKNFDGRFSSANLILDAKALAGEGNMITAAFTSAPKGNNISITFNTNALNRPTLDIARTFMHEMIHAEMYRKLLTLSNTNGSIDRDKLNKMITNRDYPGLEDYYVRYGRSTGPTMQHELMAAHYVEIIGNFLRQIDSGLSKANAEAIAWRGLTETSTWKEMERKGETQKLLKAYDEWAKTASTTCSN